jgi:hypothetical protein
MSRVIVVSLLLVIVLSPLSVHAQGAPQNPDVLRQATGRPVSDTVSLSDCPGFANVSCYGAHITEWIRAGVSKFTGWSGAVLNQSIEFSVLKMGQHVNNAATDTGIRASWSLLRDFANIILIFILLAIGIATILRVEGYGMRQLLAKLIIVAVLINFSFFLTRVVIDASNLIAVQVYSKSQMLSETPSQAGDSNTPVVGTKFLEATGVMKTIPRSDAGKIDYETIILNNLLAIPLILVVAFVFLAGAVLLLVRYIALILLMILSPLAFVGFILPSTAAVAKKWSSSLINYSLFAPIFLALLAVGITLVSSNGLKSALGIQNNWRFTSEDLSQVGALLVMYILAVGFFVAALIISKSLSIAGGETAVKWGGSLRKFGTGAAGAVTVGAGGALLRGTVGRAASSVAGSKFMLDSAKKSRVGGAALKVLRGVGGTSFDARALPGIKDASKELGLGAAAGKGGYQATLEKQAKKRLEFAKGLSKESAASAETWTQDEITEGMRLRGEVGSAEAKETFATKKETSAKTDDEKEKAQKEKEKAQKEKEKAQKDYDDYVRGGRFKERGKKRQETYADNLSERKALGFLWRPRKNREAAGLIRGNLRKSPADVANDAIISAVEKNKPKEDT